MRDLIPDICDGTKLIQVSQCYSASFDFPVFIATSSGRVLLSLFHQLLVSQSCFYTLNDRAETFRRSLY